MTENSATASIAASTSTSLSQSQRRLSAPIFAAFGLGLSLVITFAQGVAAQQGSVTAIDIALEPDQTMIQHTKDANARLLKEFSQGLCFG